MDTITIIQVLLLITKMMIKRERQNNTKKKGNHNKNTLLGWGHWDWSERVLAIIPINTKWSFWVWMTTLQLRASSASGRKASKIQVPEYVSYKITSSCTWDCVWHSKGISTYFLTKGAICIPCRELPNCPSSLHPEEPWFLPIEHPSSWLSTSPSRSRRL